MLGTDALERVSHFLRQISFKVGMNKLQVLGLLLPLTLAPDPIAVCEFSKLLQGTILHSPRP